MSNVTDYVQKCFLLYTTFERLFIYSLEISVILITLTAYNSEVNSKFDKCIGGLITNYLTSQNNIPYLKPFHIY